jgi:alpha-N-acetylglucosaminidase
MNLAVFWALSALLLGINPPPVTSIAAKDAAAVAAHRSLDRVFPSVARRFSFKTVPSSRPLTYSYQAKNGQVLVTGPNAVSHCRGAYDYLRRTVGAQATWSGTTLGSTSLPDMPRTEVTSPYAITLQDNVCVFGYTTAFFGWKEWEHYLDVMALHGLNMQFAPVGGEAIWDRVWTKLGVSRKDLDQFFTGPAFLPWHRMGNVNGHDGPLPASYQSKSIRLQKQILGRMRELGIQPVAPAFAGFVPPGFKARYPDENVLPVAAWAGFEEKYRTQILHPLSPMYAKIGGEYIREWRKEFGDARYYLADSFNELEVPVSADRAKRLEELSGFGKAVYDGIRSGDPKGTWVMQGWLFYNAGGFWDRESVAALLKPVPNDRMLILDLFAEAAPIWRAQEAFYGKQWILSNITTWGGNNQVYGNFEMYRKLSAETLKQPNRGNLVGFGISFEGSESNEAQFELLCDTAWSAQPISMDRFLPQLVKDRYGKPNSDALGAWQLFERSVYRMGHSLHPNHLVQSRPFDLTPTSRGAVHDSAEFRQGVLKLIAAYPALGKNSLYRADVAQFSAQLMLLEADYELRDAGLAVAAGDLEAAQKYQAKFRQRVELADQLLQSHPLDRLDRWVAQARQWGDSPAEKAYYEADAKRQVTVWGGPVLTEYAAKMWSGLVKTYYAPRWERWLIAKATEKPAGIPAFEETWIKATPKWAAGPKGDPIPLAVKFAEELRTKPPVHLATTLLGTPIGSWESGSVSTEFREKIWTTTVSGPGKLTVRFQYTGGAHRLDIRQVALWIDGKLVGVDQHDGRTGLEDVANTFEIEVPSVPNGTKVEIRAMVRSDGGSDSNGTVYVRLKPRS